MDEIRFQAEYSAPTSHEMTEFSMWDSAAFVRINYSSAMHIEDLHFTD